MTNKAQRRHDPKRKVAYEITRKGDDHPRIYEDVDDALEELFEDAFPDSPEAATYRSQEYELRTGAS